MRHIRELGGNSKLYSTTCQKGDAPERMGETAVVCWTQFETAARNTTYSNVVGLMCVTGSADFVKNLSMVIVFQQKLWYKAIYTDTTINQGKKEPLQTKNDRFRLGNTHREILESNGCWQMAGFSWLRKQHLQFQLTTN